VQRYLRVSPEITTRSFGAELVILNLSSGCFFGLCPAGTLFWHKLLDRNPIAQSIEQLSVLFQVDHQQLGNDLRNFAVKLCDAGLLIPDSDLPRSTPQFDLRPISAPLQYASPELFRLGHLRDLTSVPLRPDGSVASSPVVSPA